MFKFNLLSLFQSQPKSTVDNTEIPKEFLINNDDDRVLNISMVNDLDNDFININLNELTYAEVAKLNIDKPIDYSKLSHHTKKHHGKHGKHSRSIKDTEDELNDSIQERFKSNFHYRNHKQFKSNERKKKAKGKKKH